MNRADDLGEQAHSSFLRLVKRILVVAGFGLLICCYVGFVLPVAWSGLSSTLDGSMLPYQLRHVLARLPGLFPLHMAASAIALALVPIAAFCKRWPHWHRPLGRIAAICVLAGGLAAMPVALNSVATWPARLGFLAQAATWLALLFLGHYSARIGNYQRHARWMAGMIALTVSPVLLRVMVQVVIAWRLPFAPVYAVIAWVSWLLPLAGTWLWQSRHCLFKSVREISINAQT